MAALMAALMPSLIKKPWLWLPAGLAHDLAPLALQLQSAFCELNTPVWKPLEWRGLRFPNPLGIAGGVDKDAALMEEWWKQGAGFLEIGTVTPLAQKANPGKIIARDLETEAIWNRMGFPGSGVASVRENLREHPRPWPTPVFANIGKNRNTTNESASQDYATCIRELAGLVDAFVINISSPNTAGLRELFEPVHVKKFLSEVIQARNQFSWQTPLLLKLSPDMDDDQIEAVVDTALELGIAGIIATNTTLERKPGSPFPPEGGVSGRPLAGRAKGVLTQLTQILDQDHLLISVGGIMTPEDVAQRLALGADLVQVYSALVYNGPWFFKKVAQMQRSL